MIKFDILDYGVYANGDHIADFEDEVEAKSYAKARAARFEVDTVIINNFTGEVIAEYEVFFQTTVTIKESVAD